MEFYNLKTRKHVEVPEDKIKKRKVHLTTKNGTKQVRYQLVGDDNGNNVYRFVNQAKYDELNVPETD